jgi:hypothetical protein
LIHKHYSEIENYSYTNKEGAVVNENFDMRIEVGLLTRNIVIQGDEDSVKNNYGAHLMMHGKA